MRQAKNETKHQEELRERIDANFAEADVHSKNSEECSARGDAMIEEATAVFKKSIKLAKEEYRFAAKHERKANACLRKAFQTLYRLEGLSKDGKTVVEVSKATPNDTRILQAFSYTVFDTILFSITQGAAPDFTLLSQSALFETVYINIARGYDSYLFNDIPASAPGVIIAGRALLESLRDDEDRYLDEEDLWDTYASVIQTWWINTALPILFGERDSDWDNVAFPAYEEMQHWKSGEFSQRQHFPAISDLVEIAKDNALTVSEQFNFKSLLNA